VHGDLYGAVVSLAGGVKYVCHRAGVGEFDVECHCRECDAGEWERDRNGECDGNRDGGREDFFRNFFGNDDDAIVKWG
jgi:hypothetical protein